MRTWQEHVHEQSTLLIFINWQLAFITVAILPAYELAQLWVQRRRPGLLACAAHANLRKEWSAALSKQPASEILAIQTLRNSLMSATMTASTAALGLIGAATLLAPTLNSSSGANGWIALEPPRSKLAFCSQALASATGVVAMVLTAALISIGSWGVYQSASALAGCTPQAGAAYNIYGVPVVVPCADTVVQALGGLPEMQVQVLQVDRGHMAGNHVLLRCKDADVLLGHLMPGSMKVKMGDDVAAGSSIGAVGNTGNTGEPHLYIHAHGPELPTRHPLATRCPFV